MSRTSRASSDSLPTRAMADGLANLALRNVGPGGVAEAPADDAADADNDPAGDIGGRHAEKQSLWPVEHAVNEAADQDEDQGFIRLVEVDALEAVVAPGAYHEETQQGEQAEPEDGERPPGERLAIEGENHCADHGGGGGDGQADEVFAVGASGVFGDGVLLNIEPR